jgi:DNA-binding LytR/AlgR family response regulator
LNTKMFHYIILILEPLMKTAYKPKILVIEDNPTWSTFIESIIFDSIYELVGSANTLAKAKAMIEGFKPDIIISDILIQDTTIFKLINETKIINVPIVLMTNHLDGEYYDLTLDIPKSTFLAKPFHKFTLLSTLDLLLNKFPIIIPEQEKYLTIRNRQQQDIKLFLNEITWIYAEGNYSYINTIENRKFAKKKSLSKLIEDLDARFIMVHKGFAINTHYIQRIDLSNKKIIVHDNVIPIGRGYRELLNPFLYQKY